MIEFSAFILGGCIGWGIALFMAGAFGADGQKKEEKDEY